MNPQVLGYLCMASICMWMFIITVGTFWYQDGAASIEVWVFAVVACGLLYLCYMTYPF